MYTKGFFINNPVGNNAFSIDKRVNKQLYIPEIINISGIDSIELQDDNTKIAFEDFDFEGNLITAYGLKNFYRITWRGKQIILFDNHNHAFYFWYEARNNGLIKDANLLIHIDEHSDMRDNNNYLFKTDSLDLNKVFEYTNYTLNVGNYIVPALKEGLIKDVVQIRNSHNIEEYFTQKDDYKNEEIILNIDLDFFSPELDYISVDKKKKIILDIAENAKIITVSTSPFFINQELAIKRFKEIFFI